MALQINVPLTTKQGFNVPSGSYCWLQEERAKDFKYSVLVNLVFFKDKAAFDLGRSRFNPNEIPDSMNSFRQEFTAGVYASITASTIHNFIKAQLENVLGANTVAIVQ